MTHYWHTELGTGAVESTPGRVMIHFGTPPDVVEAQMKLDRLRSNGFLFATGIGRN